MFLVAFSACCGASPAPSYLFVWAGDAAHKASDFLAVIDASPASAGYGGIVASIATGVAGSHPHHTEHEMPANGHLLANGFHAGRTWLFDLSQPRQPRLLTAFGDVAGFSHPHTFIRLANGNVLATFQYRSDPPAMSHQPDPGTRPVIHSTGGLVEMDERGQIVRSTSASDPAIQNASIYPYSVLPVPAFDRAISTTTDMDEANTKATSQWLQVWRLSDLTLLRSVALTPGPRGDEHQFTGEPRLLGDGQSVYIHTFNCGLYLLRGIDRREPTVTFVRSFQGKNCGIPILTGHYWLQTVPEAHAVVVLDIANPEQPRDVQTFPVGDDEQPHWLAIDATGRRIVLNSSGGGTGNRLFVLNFDPATGQLSFDDRFRDAGSMRPGIVLTGKTWPHGFSGTAVPHGTVFSR
jgi:subtilisin family serine protease